MAALGNAAPMAGSEPILDDRLRHLANLPGHYYLEKWRTADDRPVSSFACRIQRISPRMLSLSAPVGGTVGDWVTTHFDEFGVLRGPIARALGFGFVISLRMPEADRAKLASKVLWFERRRNYEVAELRRHRRIVPRNPQSLIILADGVTLPCFVIDMSVSGAAVSADIDPPIGMPLALGSVVGRVIRILDPGFAIEFIDPLDMGDLERRLIRPAMPV
ncbi:PilZ domain-containing protein [Pelagibacterium sediminicola]|uniref:PilZ domain-containing protein n=1 Tax=Pelagibacterium sediminicola TaxID=2248761 RepID=UPI000E311642|nr:PilZ domain-containing protein [Pelagibacterium sediminicola]